MFLQYTCKCVFIYACKQSPPSPGQFPWNSPMLSSIKREFHSKRAINVGSTDRNPFISLSKVCVYCVDLHDTHDSSRNCCADLYWYYPNLMKSVENRKKISLMPLNKARPSCTNFHKHAYVQRHYVEWSSTANYAPISKEICQLLE
jgi:hypothetical protein